MPPEFSADPYYLWSAGILLLAFFIRGIAGFGSGLIAIPLLALYLPVPLVVPVLALLDYLAALVHGIRHREHIAWRELLPLVPFTLLGSLAALYLLNNLDTVILRRALGLFVLLYALYALSGFAPRRAGSRLWAAPFGTLGGLISTLFGTGGPPYIVYLHLRHITKSAFRPTLAVIFLIDGSTRVAGYAITGLLDMDILWLTLAATPLVLLAMYIGEHIHTNLSARAFSRMIGVMLLGSGTALLLR